MSIDEPDKTMQVALTSFSFLHNIKGFILNSEAVKVNFGKPKNWFLFDNTLIDITYIPLSNRVLKEL